MLAILREGLAALVRGASVEQGTVTVSVRVTEPAPVTVTVLLPNVKVVGSGQ